MANWRLKLGAYLPRTAVVLHDLFMVWACWQLLHWVRYLFLPVVPPLPLLAWSTVAVLAVQGLFFWKIGLYRGIWRFASVADLFNIFKASFLGALCILAVLAFRRLDGVPISVVVAYPFALSALLGGPRLLYRAWKDYQSLQSDAGARRVLILGAGQAAETLLRDLRRSGDYEPVGLLDDALHLQGAQLQGVPVLGTLDDAGEVARETAAKLLVIAIPTLDAAGMQRVVAICEGTGIPFRTVPRIHHLLEGSSLPGQLKEVAIEDLLGRQPVAPNWTMIRSWLEGRTVVVTGAGGSIGSELCRQCARQGVSRIILVEINELSLLTIHGELQRSFPDLVVDGVLGDCGDPAVIRHALGRARADALFHAAAYKQVPVLEDQLREAVRNNVLATETVARASVDAGVPHFVLISTDKAVDPINVLGGSKRFAEMICQAYNARASATRFVTVRFGNVLGSAGSVVPLFRSQIERGGPVTVTHPEVTRYFMTIPEACQLILQAVASSSRGAIYTLDMGEPVLIRVLAEQMIRLAGKQPGRDIAIVYTGLRPGEKLHETLFYSDENCRPTGHSKILEAGVRHFSNEVILESIPRLREAVAAYDTGALREIFFTAMPEFRKVAPGDSVKANVVPFPLREAGRN